MLVLIALFALATSWGTCSAAEAAESTRPLKVISYNVQFLPGVAAIANKRRDPEYRARMLGEKMADYDIVGLNETFERKHRDQILAGLEAAWKEDFHAFVSPEPGGNRFNGGLTLGSRLPQIETHSMIYRKASSPEKYGIRADGFAAKGALHVRIWRGGDASRSDFLDVFVTHMEARDDRIREEQYVEFAQFVRDKSDPDRPTILLGDFNTNGNPPQRQDANSQYARLTAAFKAKLPDADVVDLWPLLKPDQLGGTSEQESSEEGKRIDYIFFSNPNDGAARLEPLDVRVNPFLDERVDALSDHSAVEGDFHWIEPQ